MSTYDLCWHWHLEVIVVGVFRGLLPVIAAGYVTDYIGEQCSSFQGRGHPKLAFISLSSRSSSQVHVHLPSPKLISIYASSCSSSHVHVHILCPRTSSECYAHRGSRPLSFHSLFTFIYPCPFPCPPSQIHVHRSVMISSNRKEPLPIHHLSSYLAFPTLVRLLYQTHFKLPHY